jgi:hypothetical protein
MLEIAVLASERAVFLPDYISGLLVTLFPGCL